MEVTYAEIGFNAGALEKGTRGRIKGHMLPFEKNKLHFEWKSVYHRNGKHVGRFTLHFLSWAVINYSYEKCKDIFLQY